MLPFSVQSAPRRTGLENSQGSRDRAAVDSGDVFRRGIASRVKSVTGAAGISLLGRQGRLWHVHRAHLMHPAGTPAAMLPRYDAPRVFKSRT